MNRLNLPSSERNYCNFEKADCNSASNLNKHLSFGPQLHGLLGWHLSNALDIFMIHFKIPHFTTHFLKGFV